MLIIDQIEVTAAWLLAALYVGCALEVVLDAYLLRRDGRFAAPRWSRTDDRLLLMKDTCHGCERWSITHFR